MASYKFKCKDIGVKDDFEVKDASSKEEVMQIAAVHAKAEHGMQSVPADVAAMISASKEVQERASRPSA